MNDCTENSPNLPTPEMLALVASAFRDGESTNIGSNATRSWRHIPADRLWELLSSLNLKSLLFSPLVDQIPRHTPYFAPDLASFTRRRMMGTTRDGEAALLGHDLLVRSLEHRFSAYGHKIWLGDVEESVPAAVFCSAINESLKLVVTGADDGLIKVWSVGDGKLIATLRGHSAEVCDVRFSPCSDFLVSLCQDDRSVMIWKKQDQSFSLHRRIVERGSDDSPLKPMHIDFAACEGTSKLVIAYSEGIVAAYDCDETAIAEIGRFSLVQARSEIVCFGVLPSARETVSIAVSVKRRQMSPSIFLVRLKAGGSPPRTAEYSYPVTGSATISQIQCAHNSSSFVANDDESTGSLVFFKEESFEYEQIVLVSPDGTLTDGSLLRNHLMHKSSSAAIPLNFSVIDAVFTKNDEFILASLCGQPRNPTSIGEDDAGSVYCLLVFRTDSGRLVGILGQETCRDQIFAIGSIAVSIPNSPFSYVYYGSYDGSLSVSRIRSWGLDGNELVVHDLARFNINTDRGSNVPRSILDAQASFDANSGDLVMVVSDSLGSVSVFTNTNHENKISSPSEQFFVNDYDPGVRVTTKGTLCDSRMVPLCDLLTPSPPIVARLRNSLFLNTTGPLVQKLDVKASVRKIERAPVSEEDRLRKKQREDRLQRLAAMVRGRSPEQRDHDQRLGTMDTGRSPDQRVHAVSERVNRRAAMEELSASRRRQALGLRPRTTTTTRNPIGDQDSEASESTRHQRRRPRISSEEDSVPRSRRRGARGPPRNNITDEDSSSDEDSVVSSTSSEQQQQVVVPTQLRRDVFIRNQNRQTPHVCCLCRKTPSPDLLGPFPISDLDDCYFHPACLFSLTGLEVESSEPPRLSFSNLDVLARRAINQGKCAKVGGCLGSTRLGAGIKCYNCRLVYHYDCAIATAVNSGYYLDPARDPLFVCPRCDAPTGLDHFSRRPRWRREAHVRAWLNMVTSGSTFVPQVGDTVVYFPPKIDSGKPVSDLISQNQIHSMTDLSVLTWKSASTPARVDSIAYVFPSFFDDEDRAIVMVVGLVGLQDGLPFKIHYRPRINASDVLVLKSRVDAALATNFLRTARPGMRVRIPVDGGVPDDGVIEHVWPNTDGWECFEIKSVVDGSISRYSLWELDLGLASRDSQCGIPEHQASFLIGWIQRIVQGPVKSARNRISVGPGMDVFKACPSTQEGGESYLEIIEYPMWLDLIVEKLEGSVYRSVEELKRDTACIHSNCAKYNDPNSLLVAEANTLVETLLLLVGLTVEDYPLYAVPPLPRGHAEERRAPSPPRSIRVIKRKVLVCNHCGARREVDQDVFDDFTSSGKRVRCRWIGFVCEQEEDVEPSPLRPRRSRHN